MKGTATIKVKDPEGEQCDQVLLKGANWWRIKEKFNSKEIENIVSKGMIVEIARAE